jgi:hypothetical protein
VLEFAHALLQITGRRVGMGEDRLDAQKAQRHQFSLSPSLQNRWARQARATVSARFDLNGMFAESLARI